MKSTLKIETFNNRLGSSEARVSTFNTEGVMELLNVIVDTIKEFSADRGKRKLVVSLMIEKKGR